MVKEEFKRAKTDQHRFNEKSDNSNFWILITTISGLVAIIILLLFIFWYVYKRLQSEKQTMSKKLEQFSGNSF